MNLAFVSGESSGLFIVDISNSSNPSVIANANTPYPPIDICIDQQYAYILDCLEQAPVMYFGLRIFDISNPQYPFMVGQYDSINVALSLDIEGNYAFIASDGDGLTILDISDRTNPQMVSVLFSEDYVEDVHVEGEYAFLSLRNHENWEYGLTIANVSSPASPDTLGRYDCSGYYVVDVDVEGSYAFAAISVERCLNVVNIGDIWHPFLVGSLDYIGYRSDQQIDIDSGFACMAVDIDGLFIIDVSNPENPILARQYHSLHRHWGVNAGRGYVYLPDSYDGIRIYGLVDTSFFLQYHLPGRPVRGCIVDTLYYVAAGGVWLVLDISIPTNPSLVASYTMASCQDISIFGNYAFVRHNGAFSIWDITDPADAEQLGLCETPGGCAAVEAYGQFAFVADNYEGIQIINYSDPYNPFIESTYQAGGCALNLTIHGDLLFAANKTSLQILQIVNQDAIDEPRLIPKDFSLSQNYPNPFNAATTISYSLPNDFAGSLSTYDIAVPLVRTLDIAPGSSHIAWDGLNNAGHPVSSGIYFYAIAGYPDTARKMVLLR
jgi:hypothetical protein